MSELFAIKEELKTVWPIPEETIKLNARGIVRIVLCTDGFGIGGMYDRIHVFSDDGSRQTYPAHNMFGWELRNE